MQVNLTDGEQARLHYTTTSNVEAWTLWVKGLFPPSPGGDQGKTGRRRSACWQRALELDPASAALNGMLAFLYTVDARFGWLDDRKTALGKARRYVDRALELDPDNPDANTASSFTLLMEGRYDDAAAHARRAALLAPGSADTATFACFVLAFAGYPHEAVAHGERAMTLSPNYPAYYLGHLGNAYRLAGRVADAIAAFKAYHARHPGFGLHRPGDHLSAARPAGRGGANGAATVVPAPGFHHCLMGRAPSFSADTARLEADIAALRAAGLPMD